MRAEDFNRAIGDAGRAPPHLRFGVYRNNVTAALVTALVGGVMALYTLAMRRLALVPSFRSMKVPASPTSDGASRSGHVPYGVAMATGALVVAWLSPKLL